MDPILQSDIDILILRHLAAYSCTETAKSLIKEKPELRFYVQMQMSNSKGHLLGGCTPATDSIQKLRGTQLVHASLRDVIMEFFYAKSIVKQMIERIIFEWQALRFDDVGLLDSMTTHLKSISKLLEKLWKEKPVTFDRSTSTLEDNILISITTADAEVQTVEMEDESVQIMFYNNLLCNTNFQEKIADSINEQLANPQTTRNEEVVVKKVCSKTESEIDAFLREMLQDTDTDGTECDVGSPHGASDDVELTEQAFVNVEQNFISMFNDAESLIHVNKASVVPVVPNQVRNPQKQQLDVVEMLTTPKKIDVPLPSLIRSDKKGSVNPVYIKERFISPEGQNYSVKTFSGGLSDWNKLGRRSIKPNIPVPVSTSTSTNKRKAKFATPLKLTSVSAVTSSGFSPMPNSVTVKKSVEAITQNSNSPNITFAIKSKPLDCPDLEDGEIDIDSEIEVLPLPQIPTSTKKPTVSVPTTVLSTKTFPTPSSSTLLNMKPPQHYTSVTSSLTNSSTYFSRMPLTRPVAPGGLQSHISPIKILRTTPKPLLQHSNVQNLSPLVTKVASGEQTPQVVLASPKVNSENKPIIDKPKYSPITPATPASVNPTLPSSSTMSPFLRKLVASAQKVKSGTVTEIAIPNKKSYSTPRKKNFVRNLQFKTPPSLGKAVSKTCDTLTNSTGELSTKEDCSSLPRIRSKKRLEWSEELGKSKEVAVNKNDPTMNIISIPDVANKVLQDKQPTPQLTIVSVKREVSQILQPVTEMHAPKLLIKNRNTVISVSTPKAILPSPSLTIISGPVIQDPPEEIEPVKSKAVLMSQKAPVKPLVMPPPEISPPQIKQPDNLKRKKSITPPTPAKRGRKSKRVKEAEAARSEACNAVIPVGKGQGRGRGRTPRKKFSGVKSPLRNILPKPAPGNDVSPELPSLQQPSNAIVNSSSNFILVPQSQFPSFSNALSATASSCKVSKVTFGGPKPALVTPLTTPLKSNISPEELGLPHTPRICVSLSNDSQSDIEPTQPLKLNYECDTPFKNISQFFSTPLKSGTPMTPGKPDNPIVIDESSQSCSRDSIFDTPDKDPNGKPCILPSPFPLLKAAINGSNVNSSSASDKSKEVPKTFKSMIKTGFKVSGREKELTMSEHETVLGLLHMSEGIGSSHSKLPMGPNVSEAATPTKDVQQLLQNANVVDFLQNFVNYNSK